MAHGPERTVLILEDDPLIAAFMEKALRKKGYEVERFERGQQPWSAPAPARPACCCSTWACPTWTGWRCCAGSGRAGSTLPVVVVTSRSDPGDRLEATALGVHGYIVKPFPLADLSVAVESSVGPA